MMNLLNVLIPTLLIASQVTGECLSKGLKITDGAFWDLGVNGTWSPYRYNADNVSTEDPTWTVPPSDGWSYPQGEMGKYGENVRSQYTCSILKFCNPEATESQDLIQSVYSLPDKETFDNCDFTNAQFIDNTGANNKCVEIPMDDQMKLKKFYYANKEHCSHGQKIVVNLMDWQSTMNQCAAIADNIPASSRIRGCDCDFKVKPFSGYSALCAYAYRERCLEIEQKDDACCEAKTCWSSSEKFDHPSGKTKEVQRRLSCNDDVPGNCYNQDGLATDVNGLGSVDCCSQTCQSCGTELGNGVKWVSCTANNPEEMSATCGSLSRYSGPLKCDFTKCPENSHWNSQKSAIRAYMGIESDSSSFSSSPNNYFALVAVVVASIVMSLKFY